ncbi:MAG: helix-turn-helix domain-containing protein [Desulfobacca sp.]|nr:helix-turn-helix domain-containing protein [Desulfobacca sp.]
MTPAELKQTRLRLGFRSRRALAEVLGVSPQTVESWETGRRQMPGWLERYLKLLEERREIKKILEDDL